MDGALGSVTARGALAEVWQDGRKRGVLFRWQVEGSASDWRGSASAQTFSPAFDASRPCLFRLVLNAGSADVLRLEGEGHVEGPALVGVRSRVPVQLRGTRLWIATTTRLPVASS
jgi:hypothetical protein